MFELMPGLWPDEMGDGPLEVSALARLPLTFMAHPERRSFVSGYGTCASSPAGVQIAEDRRVHALMASSVLCASCS